ncbi:MAG: efflux RND transporter permease subunit, partial [Rhodospirillaceae bacterium]
MLRSLVAFSLSYRLFVLALSLAVAGLGVWSFLRLPVDAYPDIAQAQVKIILKAPGMTPEEVETRVIAPIEMEMLGIPKQVVFRSMAKYAIADLTIDFADGTDIYWARQQVSERLTGVMGDLPAGVSGGLAPTSTPLSEMFMFTIEGPLSLAEKRTLLDWTIRPALRTVPGVADVNALGGIVSTFEIRPDPLAMAAVGLTFTDLREAVERSNRNDGAGRLSDGEEALIVRAVGAAQSTADLENMVMVARDNHLIRLGDVAQVGAGSLTRYGSVTKDGKGEAVEGLVVGLRGADARQIVDGVQARLADLKKTLPAGTTINVFYDRSDLIERAVATVEEALAEATVLVVVLLILFLGDWRAAAIVAVTLPMSALITFLFMRGTGLSANLMSLGGLAIAIGMLVDGAVVVVENVVERLDRSADEGHPRLNLVFRAAAEVIVPVSAGIIIIALVFLPLLSLEGLEGKLFAPVALTIVFALAGSLLVALTLVPVLSSYGLKSGHHAEPWIMRQLNPGYRRLLAAAFAHRKLVYGLSGAGLAVAVAAYLFIGKTFMPSMDEGSVVVQFIKLPTVNLEHSVATDLAAQRAIMQAVPEVTEIVARMGSDEIGLDPMGFNETDVFVRLKPASEWRGDKDFIIDELRKVMAALPGIQPTYTQPIEMRVSEMLSGARGDLVVKVFGPDLAAVSELAGRLQQVLSGVRGAAEVMTAANDRVDYLQLDIDR